MVRNKLLIYLGYGMSCLVIFLIIWEICAQIDDWVRFGASFGGQYNHDSLFIRAEDGPHCIPYARFEKWRLNNRGFRGYRDTDFKKNGMRRILCLGASETFGLYESPGKEWPAQLQKLLNQLRPGEFEVINAALPGFSLPLMIKDFEFRFLPYRPDIILLYQSNRHYFYRAKDVITQKLRNAGIKKVTQFLFPGKLTTTRRPYRPRIFRKIKQVVKPLIPSIILTFLQSELSKREFRAIAKVHGLAKPIESGPKEKLDQLEADLLQLEALCRKNRIFLALSTHQYFLDKNNLIAFQRFIPAIAKKTIPEFCRQYNLVIRAVANKTKLPLADIERAVPPDRTHFEDYCHFSDSGAACAAREFSKTILNQPKSGHQEVTELLFKNRP